MHAREEGIFAIKAERLVAPFTEERIFAIVTERLATPLTDEHLIAVVAKGIELECTYTRPCLRRPHWTLV
jgi:hypothetical protein